MVAGRAGGAERRLCGDGLEFDSAISPAISRAFSGVISYPRPARIISSSVMPALARASARVAAARDGAERKAAVKARSAAAISCSQALAQVVLSGALSKVVDGFTPRQLGALGVFSSGVGFWQMYVKAAKAAKAAKSA